MWCYVSKTWYVYYVQYKGILIHTIKHTLFGKLKQKQNEQLTTFHNNRQ